MEDSSTIVSIPDGKPRPFRRRVGKWCHVGRSVSIPDGKPRPFRLPNPLSRTGARRGFQSQTGSLALSDQATDDAGHARLDSFNPRREASPFQTGHADGTPERADRGFQSQTGSLALSDCQVPGVLLTAGAVSIPDGKPRPFRRTTKSSRRVSRDVSIPDGKPRPFRQANTFLSCVFPFCFNPRREASPFQTAIKVGLPRGDVHVSIPDGKPRPFRPAGS